MGHPYSFLAPLAWIQRRAVPTTSSTPDGPAPSFDQALKLLEQGRSADAFGAFAALANSGHAPSARIALTLARRGSALFGGRYAASAGERERWERFAQG